MELRKEDYEEQIEANKPTINRKLIVLIFVLGSFVTVLNQTVLITALPQIMKSFNISIDKAQWLTTAYLMTNGILIPVTAFLINKYTTRQLFITAIGLFVIGTVIAGLSNNFETLLVARVIQACGAGITIPLMQTVIFMIFPKERRGAIMGIIGLIIGFAPAIGPTLSGFIVDNFSWRHIFFLVLPISIISLIFAIVSMKNVGEVSKGEKIDLLSLILSTIGFGALLYSASLIGATTTANIHATISLVIGAIGIVLLVIRSSKLERPMLEFKVLKSYVFTLSTIMGIVSFIALMAVETILPLYLQSIRGLNAFHSGLTILPGAIVMGIVSLVAGKVYDKIGAKPLAIIGFLIMTLTTIPFILLKVDTSIALLATFYALRLIGVAMIMMTLTTEGLNALPQNIISHGTAMNNTLRQIGGSIGTALMVTISSAIATNAMSTGKITNAVTAEIHGMNYGFIFVTVLSIIGFLLSFKLKSKKQA